MQALNAAIAEYPCGWLLYRDHAPLNQQRMCYVADNENMFDYVGATKERVRKE